jgi:hypothetical protein
MYKYKYDKYIHKHKLLLKETALQKVSEKVSKYELKQNYLEKHIPKKMKNLETIKNFKICSYNIWANNKYEYFSKLNCRLPYIVDEILRFEPDIICFQNINDESIEFLKKKDILKLKYYFIEQTYNNTYILSKYKCKSIEQYVFDNSSFIISKFKNLDIINININNNNELLYIKKLLNKLNNVIICGSIYFDPDMQPTELEPLNLNDMWKTIHNDKKGYTYDTSNNKMAWNMKQKRTQQRKDVILYSKFKPLDIKLIGAEPIFSIPKNDNNFLKHIKNNKLDNRFVKYINDMIFYWNSIRFGLIGYF